MQESRSFAQSKKRGNVGEKVFRQWFLDRHPEFAFQECSPLEDRAGIDGWMSFSYQVKFDEQAHKTGNVFIETVSVSTTGALGWAFTCAAGFLFYVIPGLGFVYECRPAAIRDALEDWQDIYESRDKRNAGYFTRGVLVPINVFGRVASRLYVVESLRREFLMLDDE